MRCQACGSARLCGSALDLTLGLDRDNHTILTTMVSKFRVRSHTIYYTFPSTTNIIYLYIIILS